VKKAKKCEKSGKKQKNPKNSGKKWKKRKIDLKRSENCSSEAKRKIWSKKKRKEAKKEKWNFIVK
jgi:hypothetical protein